PGALRKLLCHEAEQQSPKQELNAELVVAEDVKNVETGSFPEQRIPDHDRVRVSGGPKIRREINDHRLVVGVEQHVAGKVAVDQLLVEGDRSQRFEDAALQPLSRVTYRDRGLAPGDVVRNRPSVLSLLEYLARPRVWSGQRTMKVGSTCQ